MSHFFFLPFIHAARVAKDHLEDVTTREQARQTEEKHEQQDHKAVLDTFRSMQHQIQNLQQQMKSDDVSSEPKPTPSSPTPLSAVEMRMQVQINDVMSLEKKAILAAAKARKSHSTAEEKNQEAEIMKQAAALAKAKRRRADREKEREQDLKSKKEMTKVTNMQKQWEKKQAHEETAETAILSEHANTWHKKLQSQEAKQDQQQQKDDGRIAMLQKSIQTEMKWVKQQEENSVKQAAVAAKQAAVAKVAATLAPTTPPTTSPIENELVELESQVVKQGDAMRKQLHAQQALQRAWVKKQLITPAPTIMRVPTFPPSHAPSNPVPTPKPTASELMKLMAQELLQGRKDQTSIIDAEKMMTKTLAALHSQPPSPAPTTRKQKLVREVQKLQWQLSQARTKHTPDHRAPLSSGSAAVYRIDKPITVQPDAAGAAQNQQATTQTRGVQGADEASSNQKNLL